MANAKTPSARARSARYDAGSGRIILELRNDVAIAIPVTRFKEIAKASSAQLSAVEVIGAGNILHWEELDADYSVPALVAEAIGHRTVAREAARAAGRVSSPEKAAAARANGQKGGRPRTRKA